jgi:hypothetical protein
MGEFLAQHWSNLLSVLFGLGTILFARRAAVAAREAREAVRRQTVAEELGEAARKVRELSRLMSLSEWKWARFMAEEIRYALTWLCARWKGHFDTGSLDNLTTAQFQLATAVRQLEEHPGDDLPQTVEHAIRRALERAVERVIEEHGKAARRVGEREGGPKT